VTEDEAFFKVLSIRTANALRTYGVKTIKAVTEMTESDLICVRSLGPSGVKEVKSRLEAFGHRSPTLGFVASQIRNASSDAVTLRETATRITVALIQSTESDFDSHEEIVDIAVSMAQRLIVNCDKAIKDEL
jgi:hypothetical protein